MTLINKTILANKILNELRYNKRYMYNWVQWFGVVEGDFTEIRKFLEVQIEKVIKEIEYSTFDVEQCAIDAIPLFKKIDLSKEKSDKKNKESFEEKREKNVISFSAENKIKGDIKYNLFLHSDLKIMILGAIWVDIIGRDLDKNNLPNYIYANRVSQNTSSIFKPYFRAYSDFRDASFSEVKTLIEKNKTGILVQTDLSRCFYSVNIKKLRNEINSLLEDNRADETVIKLNTYVFEVIEKYNNLPLVKEYINKMAPSSLENKKVLPIGFFPSNVLINIYLRGLDMKIQSRQNPIQYGRYVDDLFLVFIEYDIEKTKNRGTI